VLITHTNKTTAKAYRQWRRRLLWYRVQRCRHLHYSPSVLHVTQAEGEKPMAFRVGNSSVCVTLTRPLYGNYLLMLWRG